MIQFPIVPNPYSHLKLSQWINKLAQLNLLDFQVLLDTLHSMQSEYAYNNLLEVLIDLTPLYPDELFLLEFDLKKDIESFSEQIICPISECNHSFSVKNDYNHHYMIIICDASEPDSYESIWEWIDYSSHMPGYGPASKAIELEEMRKDPSWLINVANTKMKSPAPVLLIGLISEDLNRKILRKSYENGLRLAKKLSSISVLDVPYEEINLKSKDSNNRLENFLIDVTNFHIYEEDIEKKLSLSDKITKIREEKDKKFIDEELDYASNLYRDLSDNIERKKPNLKEVLDYIKEADRLLDS